MNLGRNKLYITLMLACLAGYIWIYFGIFQGIYRENHFEVCIIKRITNIPCPSCGTTRSVAEIFKGNYQNALLMNPLGFIITLILIIAPSWIILDVLIKKQSFFVFYQSLEQKINKPIYSVLLISLVLINWVWNITKQL